MSDLWDYGSSSSEEEDEALVSIPNDECRDGTDRDLARYMSSEQKKKYRDILDVEIAPGDIQLMGDRRRCVDEVVLVEDDKDDEDGFEALWRKEREAAIAMPEYDSGDNEGVGGVRGGTAGRGSVPPKRKRGRPRKNAMGGTSPPEGQCETGASAGQEASRAYIALRACLQDDDVSDVEVASDDDEDLKRIKAMREKRAKQELEAQLDLVAEYRPPSKCADIDEGGVDGGERGGDLIELRFVDKQRHEFVALAVPTSTFDFPCSKFVVHAIEQGWIKSEDDVLQFVFDDEELSRTEHSPQMFDMEDGDTIDVHYVK